MGPWGRIVPDWGTVADRIREEATDSWDDRVAVDRFTDKGGIFVRGAGEVLSATEVRVGDIRYAVRRAVVVATGTSAAIPPIPGLADVEYWTNRHVVEARVSPGRSSCSAEARSVVSSPR